MSLDDLVRGERIHRSRNPRLVRALVDLGVVRDQGEGIPRMFAEMAGQFLPAPTLKSTRRSFTVVLQNTPTLSVADREFVASLGSEELSSPEFRALLEAHRHGSVDNGRFRALVGLDTLGASRLLGRLRDRGRLILHGGGASSFYTLAESVDRKESGPDRKESGPDRKESGPDRKEFAAGPAPASTLETELPLTLRAAIRALGARPRKERLWPVIADLCAIRAWKPAELTLVLSVAAPDMLVHRHLSPMVAAGILERTHPEALNHPEQGYRTTAPASR